MIYHLSCFGLLLCGFLTVMHLFSTRREPFRSNLKLDGTTMCSWNVILNTKLHIFLQRTPCKPPSPTHWRCSSYLLRGRGGGTHGIGIHFLRRKPYDDKRLKRGTLHWARGRLLSPGFLYPLMMWKTSAPPFNNVCFVVYRHNRGDVLFLKPGVKEAPWTENTHTVAMEPIDVQMSSFKYF